MISFISSNYEVIIFEIIFIFALSALANFANPKLEQGKINVFLLHTLVPSLVCIGAALLVANANESNGVLGIFNIVFAAYQIGRATIATYIKKDI